ncbi:MAG: hypothetical protein WAN22_09635 [Solirubrobacteraceae bacterium]
MLVPAATLIHITNTSPSGWVTGVAAVVGALVGGLLAVVAQVRVEGKRAEHERDLETERVHREEERRKAEDTALLRGAARLLHQELAYVVSLFRVALESGSMWASGVERPTQLTADERRTLARKLTAEQWDMIITAQHRADTVLLSRVMMEPPGFFELTSEHAGTKLALAGALDALNPALALLATVGESSPGSAEK